MAPARTARTGQSPRDGRVPAREQPGGRRDRLARLTFASTSLVVTYGLVLQLVLAAGNDDGRFVTVPGRIVNTLSYFTVQSNILVAVTTALLAWRLDLLPNLFWVARLSALIGISITGVVFHLALADLQELTDKEAAADWVLHTVSPLLAVAGWLLFGPRRSTSARVVALSVVFPVAWLGYTLLRGAFVQDRTGRDYYPYPFLDVVDHGYARVLVNVALVALLFATLAAAALLLDRVLDRSRAR